MDADSQTFLIPFSFTHSKSKLLSGEAVAGKSLIYSYKIRKVVFIVLGEYHFLEETAEFSINLRR